MISIDVKPETISYVIRQLRFYLDKDKRSLCLTLYLLDKNIQDWYHSLSKEFANEKARILTQETRTKEELKKLLIFMQGRKNSEANGHAILYLLKIIEEYESGKLKKLSDKLDISAIREIHRLADEFTNKVFDSNWQEQIETKRDEEIKIEDITSWLTRLDKLREEIGRSVTSMTLNLGCEREAIDKYYSHLTENHR